MGLSGGLTGVGSWYFTLSGPRGCCLTLLNSVPEQLLQCNRKWGTGGVRIFLNSGTKTRHFFAALESSMTKDS